MRLMTRIPMRRLLWRGLVLLAAALVLSSCGVWPWRGIANVQVPGGPGTGGDTIKVYVQMPDTLALTVNSRVRLKDVTVGSVRAIELKKWVATLTIEIDRAAKLPKNALAKVGQTSLLGSQHVELSAPAFPQGELKDGDTIPLKSPDCRASKDEPAGKSYPCTTAFPTTERVLAAISTILRGGGIPNLEVIQNEVYNILNGRADQIRDFLTKLDVFTDQLNQQRNDLTHAIDASNRLLNIVAARNETLDRLLIEVPPLIKHFRDTQDLFTDAIVALGRISEAADNALAPTSDNLHTNLALLQRPLRELGKASPYLIGALDLLFTAPFPVSTAKNAIRGDFINVSITADLTLSAVDNGILSGTGISGMLRALEQSWGRDPETMIPDVKFTPNAHDVPGGPYVERGE